MEFERILNLPALLGQKSFFLFGPRATGKSYLINKQLENRAVVLSLLRGDLFLRLSANPSLLEEILEAHLGKTNLVVIDEIQKIPELLDEVHRLLEKSPFRFLLTGSSARKLKRGHANLLAGRAWTAHLFPLCSQEISNFDLEKYLRFGGLPGIYPSPQPEEELHAYVETYLKEEILTEGLVRRLPPFARFLKAAALTNGQILNFTQMASDCQVPPSTVREYYSILEDTLLGFFLEPWILSKKRKAVSTAKFYFFDTGVTHALAETKIVERNSNLYGIAFEQFIGMEIRAYLGYRRRHEPMTFWRSTHGYEADFLIGDHTAIEIKATVRASQRDSRGLEALAEEKTFKNFFLITQDPVRAKKGEVLQLHWRDFLSGLWQDEWTL